MKYYEQNLMYGWKSKTKIHFSRDSAQDFFPLRVFLTTIAPNCLFLGVQALDSVQLCVFRICVCMKL